MKTLLKTALRAELLVIPLLLTITGCDWFGAKKETKSAPSMTQNAGMQSDVIVTIDGKPLFTSEEFNKYLDIINREQPGIKEMLPMLPVEQQYQVYQGILDSIVLERVVGEWVKTSGLDADAEFKENARLAHEMVDRQLGLQAFQTKLMKEIAISDSEARSFYDKNKMTDPTFKRPPFLVKGAGVKAQAIVVDTEKEAKDLLAQLKTSDINQVAKKATKTVKDLGVVNPQAYGVDSAVKSKVLGFKQFPAKEVIKGSDNKFYVIEATGSQNAEYAPFEEIKEQIKQLMTNQKLADLFTKRAEELKSQFKVVISPEFVKSLIKQPAQQQAAMQEEMNNQKSGLAA